MKIEIISGTKKEAPCGANTKIKIDGKEVQGYFNSFYFTIPTADSLARYGLEFRSNTEELSFLKKIIKAFKLAWRLVK